MILFVNIKNITYRVKNESTSNLPTSYDNVALEVSGYDDFEMRSQAGMFIMNQTGYTPEDFQLWDLDGMQYGVVL